MSKGFFRRVTKHFFIVVNILAAILFLLGSYGYLFSPKHFWLVGILTLSSFYFLLALLLFAVFWLFIKPVRALISAIAIILAYGPVSNIIPLRLSHSFTKIKPEGSLRIMSWNVAQFNVMGNKKHPEIKKQMFDIINEYEPDIACFQEMVAEDDIVVEHGHVNEFLDKLKFKNYFYSYDEKEDFWGHAHFGIIIFSKYPIINKKTIHGTPDTYNSTFQYADIVKGPDTVRVFNVHLQSLRFSRSNLKYIDEPTVEEAGSIKQSKSILGKFKIGFLKRQEQAERVRAEIEKSPYPVMVCGDFNDVPNSYAYHTIGIGLTNAFAEKGGGLGRTFSGISPVLRIDNIFVDGKMKVKQFQLIQKKLSDHFPIMADIEMDKK